jgi:hypothetical protein
MNRKLVEFLRESLVSEEDCGTEEGLAAMSHHIPKEICGRTLAKDVRYGDRIWLRNTYITPELFKI